MGSVSVCVCVCSGDSSCRYCTTLKHGAEKALARKVSTPGWCTEADPAHQCIRTVEANDGWQHALSVLQDPGKQGLQKEF